MKENEEKQKYQVEVVSRAKNQLKKLSTENLKLFEKALKDLETKPLPLLAFIDLEVNNLFLYKIRINLVNRLAYIVDYGKDLIYVIHAATRETTNYKEITKFFFDFVKELNKE